MSDQTNALDGIDADLLAEIEEDAAPATTAGTPFTVDEVRAAIDPRTGKQHTVKKAEAIVARYSTLTAGKKSGERKRIARLTPDADAD